MHGTPPGPEPTTGRIGLLWGALFIAWMWMLFSGVNWRDMVTRAVHLRQVKKRLRGQDSVLELANAAAWPRDKQALKALIDTLQDYAVQHWAGTWVVVSPRNSAVSHYYQAQGMHPDRQYPQILTLQI